MCDFSDCMTTFEKTKDELEAIEEQIARKYKLAARANTRRSMICALDEGGSLEDDELLADWRATFARFLEWTESEKERAAPLA